MTLTTVVLTKNSEKTLSRTLDSLKWSEEIVIIDDQSTDATVSIAKKYGATIIVHALNSNFAQQRNFALQKAKGEWVLFVDSDEVVSKDLAKEIEKAITNETTEGFYLKRRDTMWGRQILHGENGGVELIRLGRKDAGMWEGEVHERWLIKGEIGTLANVLQHYPHPTLTEFLSDINWYSTIRADELYKKGVSVTWVDVILYPKVKFLQNYIFKKGFLDGTIGLVLAILMSMHSFLVRGKLWQLQKNK